ncbi:MAG: MipA/OmpV family protein [Pseudomonadota bacterium]
MKSSLAACGALLLGGLFYAAASSPSYAQSAFEEDGFTLGVGGGFETSPFVGANDTEFSFLPVIAFDKGPLHIGLDGISFTAVERERWQFALIAAPRMSGADTADSPFLTGIDRDLAIEVGAAGRLNFSDYYLGVTALQDVSSAHDGFELSATAGREFQVGELMVDIAAGAAYRTSDLNTYLYGVEPGEARAGREAYRPGADVTPFVEASVTYPIGDRSAVIAFAGYELFSNEVRDSPIVDANGQASIGLAFVRKF